MRAFSLISISKTAIAFWLMSAAAGCVTYSPAQPSGLTGHSQPPGAVVNASKAGASIEAMNATALPAHAASTEPTAPALERFAAARTGPLEFLLQTDGLGPAPSGTAPPVVILKLDSPIILRQEMPAAVAAQPGAAAGHSEFPTLSESSPKLPAAIEKIVDTIIHMDGTTLFGLVAVVAMLVFYTFEDRSPYCILGFALACWMGSTYGFLQGAWPFGMVEGIWGFVALRNWWNKISAGAPAAGEAPVQTGNI